MKLWELLGHDALGETLDQPIDWEWVVKQENRWTAEFELQDLVYYVILAGRDNEDVSVIFSANNSEEVTGTGNSFTVFATVGDILKSFLKHRKPKSISFTAKESSRSKLYKRLADMIAKMTRGTMRPFTDDRWGDGYRIVLESSLKEEGKIVPGVNTTIDIQPGETQRQAAKFGNKLDAKSRPPLLRGSYGDDSARFSANQGDPHYGPDGTQLTASRK